MTIKSDFLTQMVGPSLAFQYGITFCPPRGCLLETLQITGPDGLCDAEEVSDEVYSLHTSVNLTILERCKVIHNSHMPLIFHFSLPYSCNFKNYVLKNYDLATYLSILCSSVQNIEVSGASIILVVPSATEQHDLTGDLPPIAALECIIKQSNGWRNIQITTSKSFMGNEAEDGFPVVHIENGWGLAEISLENLASTIEKYVPGSIVQLTNSVESETNSVESETSSAGDDEMRSITYRLLAKRNGNDWQ